jgi:hypothetical protein
MPPSSLFTNAPQQPASRSLRATALALPPRQRRQFQTHIHLPESMPRF